MKVIAVDAGKYATKAVAVDGGREIFRTKSTELTTSFNLEAAGNSNKVLYEDRTFIIGDQGETIDYSLEKNTLIHKLAIYTAAYRLGCKGDLAAVIGCPTNIYLNKEHRKAFQDEIKHAPSKLVIDGKDTNIKFERVLIMPESSGIVYKHKELFKGRRVGVIDLGGRNMNFGIYDDLMPQPSSMITTNQGSMELSGRVKRIFEAMYKRALSERDIEEILQLGGMKYRGEIQPESKKELLRIYDEYVYDIVSGIKKEFPIDMLDMVVTGGTSSLVEDNIGKLIPHIQTVEDTQWTNADGFLEIGKVKFK